MVVGAIDSDGQPVVPLNGVNGFRNGNNAGSEKGSDYGACVEVWAPGNHIWSSWANGYNGIDVFQSNLPPPNAPYTADVYLSATSTAAPHVAGVAAYLATVQGLTTPASIERSVRNYLRFLSSKDHAGNSLMLPNLGGITYTALPTPEFVIDGQAPGNVNGSITKYSDQTFFLSYDSVGATSCSLYGYLNGSPWYTVPNYQTWWQWGNVGPLAAGRYSWTVDCVSAQGTHNFATASANIIQRPVPQANFWVNGENASNPDSTKKVFTVPTGKTFTLSYTSTNVKYCNLTAYKNGAVWYSNPNFLTSYSWGSVLLDPGTYEWTVSCFDSSGKRADAFADVIVQ